MYNNMTIMIDIASIYYNDYCQQCSDESIISVLYIVIRDNDDNN